MCGHGHIVAFAKCSAVVRRLEKRGSAAPCGWPLRADLGNDNAIAVTYQLLQDRLQLRRRMRAAERQLITEDLRFAERPQALLERTVTPSARRSHLTMCRASARIIRTDRLPWSLGFLLPRQHIRRQRRTRARSLLHSAKIGIFRSYGLRRRSSLGKPVQNGSGQLSSISPAPPVLLGRTEGHSKLPPHLCSV